MKKEVQAFILSLGGTSSYSGHSIREFRTPKKTENPKSSKFKFKRDSVLYINEPATRTADKGFIEQAEIDKFGLGLRFRLVTN